VLDEDRHADVGPHHPRHVADQREVERRQAHAGAVVAEHLGHDPDAERADQPVGDDGADDDRALRSGHAATMAGMTRSVSLRPLVGVGSPRQPLPMFLITCPVSRTDELVADRRIRSVTNHPTHVAMAVECPACGSVHVYRTGHRWETARRRQAESMQTAAARAATVAATAASARAAQEVSRA
jgi:hypothetical protein